MDKLPLLLLLVSSAKLAQTYSLHGQEHGDYGVMGYSGYNAENLGAKGHEFNARGQGFYDDHNGNNNAYAHKDKYFVKTNSGDQGEQGYKYVDGERYAKGYNIKGAHKVHKLNEFAKKTDFYDQDHDEAYKENHENFEQAYNKIKANSLKGGQYEKAYLDDKYGRSGKHSNGLYNFGEKGYDEAAGNYARYANDAEFERVKNSHGFESLMRLGLGENAY